MKRLLLEEMDKITSCDFREKKWPSCWKTSDNLVIETDLQLRMRMFIGGRNDENLEIDNRPSKFNCGA